MTINNQVFQKNQTNSIFELASILGHQNDFQEILRIVTQKTTDLFNTDIASIVMINPNTQNTIKTIIKEGQQIEEKSCHVVQTNVIGWVSKNKQSFYSKNIKTD